MGGKKSLVLVIALIASVLLLCSSVDSSNYAFPSKSKEIYYPSGLIGIHIGNTYSSVAMYTRPKRMCFTTYIPEDSPLFRFPNERGSRTTPSCVAFNDSGSVLVGESAKDQASVNPQRTICGVNPLLGKRFDDPDVQVYIKTLPYKVVDKENKPYIQVEFDNGKAKLFSPQEIFTMILRKMKEIALVYTNDVIESASIVVHQSDLDNEARRQILESANMVGLKVVDVSDSRIVAVLARRSRPQTNWRFLVYNLGGKAFHATLLDQPGYGTNNMRSLQIASKRDMHLGGQTIDTKVVDHFIDLLKSKYKVDISKDSRALAKLRIESEKAKIALSNSNGPITIRIEALADGISLFKEPLTRETFEELNMDLFNRTMELVRGVMDEGGRTKDDVDQILLVGGNAGIPKIRHMLKDLFGRELVNDDFKPDEAVAFAAAHYLEAINANSYQVLRYLEINNLCVGIETNGGVLMPYVRDEILPTTASRQVTTYYDGQTTIEINVFEGQRRFTKDCHYLGTLVLSGIPPAPRGVARINVEVEVDSKHNIRVTAGHNESQLVNSITIPGQERYEFTDNIYQVLPSFSEYENDLMEKEKRLLTPQAYSNNLTPFSIVVL